VPAEAEEDQQKSLVRKAKILTGISHTEAGVITAQSQLSVSHGEVFYIVAY
jgi:hypothetical protein